MKRIHLVMGARPNFVKVAPLYRALTCHTWADPILVHTGQHSDPNMSVDLFEDLQLPRPHIELHASGSTHAVQTAAIMMEYESVCLRERPDFVVITGDVNSSLAGCLVAKKLGIPVGHVESGLRCGDLTMPEEINRVIIDSVSDLLWTHSADATENLKTEGRAAHTRLVGNILIDSLEHMRLKNASTFKSRFQNNFGLVTLHRPANVDNAQSLQRIWNELLRLAQHLPLLFPVHPRTKARMQQFNLWDSAQNQTAIEILPPLPYSGFIHHLEHARLVITDSGGIQEEAAYLNVPCLTLRDCTERPITLTQHQNLLVSTETLVTEAKSILGNDRTAPSAFPLWDGKTSGRIADQIKSFFDSDCSAS
jgi:UDP-N-acetylglucosamine 2-epimerase (non-hydrolysing)